MQRRAFFVLLAAVIARPFRAAAEDATQVSVLDADFRPLKVLTSGPDLAAFNDQWAQRQQSPDAARQWDYKIDIQYGGRSVRWLYDAAGFTRVLTKAKAPVYRLASPSAFNQLLGISRAP